MRERHRAEEPCREDGSAAAAMRGGDALGLGLAQVGQEEEMEHLGENVIEALAIATAQALGEEPEDAAGEGYLKVGGQLGVGAPTTEAKQRRELGPGALVAPQRGRAGREGDLGGGTEGERLGGGAAKEGGEGGSDALGPRAPGRSESLPRLSLLRGGGGVKKGDSSVVASLEVPEKGREADARAGRDRLGGSGAIVALGDKGGGSGEDATALLGGRVRGGCRGLERDARRLSGRGVGWL